MRKRALVLGLATVILAGGVAFAACGDEEDLTGEPAPGEAHEQTSGDDHAGEMTMNGEEMVIHIHAEKTVFHPAVIEVKVGQRVRLTLDNHDPILHDYKTDEARFLIHSAGGAEHGEDHGDDGHDSTGTQPAEDLQALHIAAGGEEDGELVFEAMHPGEYEFYCSVPGHREGGMTGKIVVEA